MIIFGSFVNCQIALTSYNHKLVQDELRMLVLIYSSSLIKKKYMVLMCWPFQQIITGCKSLDGEIAHLLRDPRLLQVAHEKKKQAFTDGHWLQHQLLVLVQVTNCWQYCLNHPMFEGNLLQEMDHCWKWSTVNFTPKNVEKTMVVAFFSQPRPQAGHKKNEPSHRFNFSWQPGNQLLFVVSFVAKNGPNWKKTWKNMKKQKWKKWKLN